MTDRLKITLLHWTIMFGLGFIAGGLMMQRLML